MKKLTLVSSEDWQGLYVDGKLAYENHSVACKDLSYYIDLTMINVDDEWMGRKGHLPQHLDDIPKDKLR